MFRAEAAIVIERPPAEVFDFVADPHNQHLWQPGLHHVEHRGDLSSGVVIEVRKVMGRRVAHALEIVEFEPGSHIVHRGAATSHLGELTRRIEFSDLGNDRTRVAYTVSIETRGVLGRGLAAMQRLIQRETESDLRHLRDLLEAHDDLRSGMSALPALGPPVVERR